MVRIYVNVVKLRERKLPPDQKPTFTKSYAPLPNHEALVFIPATYKAGDKPLPLLIDLHGGGFCIGAPMIDTADNLQFCHRHGFCVVSVPYRLGPTYQFPTAPKDAAAMISAVLEDDTLPVDRTRVAVAGYSAGGNLSLTSVQLLSPEARKKIRGVAAYYPVTDRTVSLTDKIARQTRSPNESDSLHWMAPMFDMGYTPIGQNRADPLLSPLFAEREKLPVKISILGCEYDVLCPEAEEMTEDLAAHENGEKVPLGEGRDGWTKGNIRWEKIPGMGHGFNQTPAKGDDARVKREKTVEMHEGIANWLKKEVFS